MRFTEYLKLTGCSSRNFLFESDSSKEHGLTKNFNFKDLGLAGTELLDIAEEECDISNEISNYKYVLFGKTCLDFVANENNNKNSNFYRVLRDEELVGPFGRVYMQKNEIGLISKKVSVIFYNDKSEVAKYVKSFSIDLYTNKTFTKYVEKNGEINLDADGKYVFLVIESGGIFYGSIDDTRRKMSTEDHINYAKSMGWDGTSVNAVCAKALKERDVELLNRANDYLLSH